jgi:hypothetical protein
MDEGWLYMGAKLHNRERLAAESQFGFPMFAQKSPGY